jgi:hypothetical protein
LLKNETGAVVLHAKSENDGLHDAFCMQAQQAIHKYNKSLDFCLPRDEFGRKYCSRVNDSIIIPA